MMEKKKVESNEKTMAVYLMHDDINKLIRYFQKEQVDATNYDIWYYISVFHSKTTNQIRLFVYVSSWKSNIDKEESFFMFEENMSNASFVCALHKYLEFTNYLKLNYKRKKNE